MKRCALLVALFLPLMSPAAKAELVNLDGFIAGFGKGSDFECVPQGPLDDFLSQLMKRYFRPDTQKAKTKVNIPQQFAAAIGKASVEKYEGFTRIRLPLVGTYRGLPTRELAYDVGHDEDIYETHTRILFDASKQEVEKVFGEEIALGSVTAAVRDQGAELVCHIALM